MITTLNKSLCVEYFGTLDSVESRRVRYSRRAAQEWRGLEAAGGRRRRGRSGRSLDPSFDLIQRVLNAPHRQQPAAN